MGCRHKKVNAFSHLKFRSVKTEINCARGLQTIEVNIFKACNISYNVQPLNALGTSKCSKPCIRKLLLPEFISSGTFQVDVDLLEPETIQNLATGIRT